MDRTTSWSTSKNSGATRTDPYRRPAAPARDSTLFSLAPVPPCCPCQGTHARTHKHVAVAVAAKQTGRPLLLNRVRRYHFRKKSPKTTRSRWAGKNPKEVGARGGATAAIGRGRVGVARPRRCPGIGPWTRLFSLVTLCPGEEQHTVFLLNLCVNWPMLCIIISSEGALIGMKTP